MHPNLYLRNFWRSSFKPEVFVAMSFADEYQQRFKTIIQPAVEAVHYRGEPLTAHRVDLSKSGDSILTGIADGIAHSVMVLADISIMGYDSKSGVPYRNSNVMYEVGLALACRQPAEVLLIRDDRERLLFDVSTVPHKHVEFAKPADAQQLISEEIASRLGEIDYVRDARVSIAIASLTASERAIISAFSKYQPGQAFWLTSESFATMAGLPRLLDKQLIRTRSVTHDGHAMFAWTELGKAVADRIETLIPVVDFSTPAASTEKDKPASGE